MLGTLSLAEGPSHSSTTLFIGQQLIRHYFNLIGRISDLLYLLFIKMNVWPGAGSSAWASNKEYYFYPGV